LQAAERKAEKEKKVREKAHPVSGAPLCRASSPPPLQAAKKKAEEEKKERERAAWLKEFTERRELKELQVRTPRLSCPALSPLCNAEWSAVFAGCGD
jgi:hypothetical protein